MRLTVSCVQGNGYTSIEYELLSPPLHFIFLIFEHPHVNEMQTTNLFRLRKTDSMSAKKAEEEGLASYDFALNVENNGGRLGFRYNKDFR